MWPPSRIYKPTTVPTSTFCSPQQIEKADPPRTHGAHLKVGDAVGSRVGVCDGDQLDGAGDGVIVGGNVDGATLGEAVGVGDGDGLGDCVHAKVLHPACSVVSGHGVPVPSEIVVMVRWRLERPPPPANVGGGEAEVRASDRKTYNLRCNRPTQSKLMLRGF